MRTTSLVKVGVSAAHSEAAVRHTRKDRRFMNSLSSRKVIIVDTRQRMKQFPKNGPISRMDGATGL
jgi:hypothetical protein